MDPLLIEIIKTTIMLYMAALLTQLLRYIKMIWGRIFDIHIAVASKEDPKKYGGGNVNL
jgi:hypothetical protein